MIRFILRFLLLVLAFRVVGDILRALLGSGSSERLNDPDIRGRFRAPAKNPTKPIVDRARAIDVPFTEEQQES